MKPVRIKAIAKKEIIQIVRDPFSLAMAFLLPVMLLFIFGYAISMDVNNIRTVVYDRDKSVMSREFIARFGESGYFRVVANADHYEEIDRAIDSGSAVVALALPEDFSKNLAAGRPAQIMVAVDGSDSNTATIALGYVGAICEACGRGVSGQRGKVLVDARTRVWYNPELKSKYFIIPGLVAVIMAIIAALLTSLTIAREWERGTMEQLISTPVTSFELIGGKLAAYFLIGLIDVVITILISIYLFGVPFRGSFVLVMFLSSLFLFGGLSLGILISIVARSQLLASQAALISSYLPALLLSGFMFAISNMPVPLQIITYIIPARYFVAILKGVFLKGNAFSFMLFETVLLGVYGLIVFVIANARFKKRIE